MRARWTYRWRFGRRPQGDPNAPAVPRYWSLVCGLCGDWSTVYVDRFRGPVEKSKRAVDALMDHLDGHWE